MPHPRPSAVVALIAAVLSLLLASGASGQAPDAPSNLRAKNVTNFARDAIRVRWTAPPDGGAKRTGYEIFRSETTSGPFGSVAELPPAATEFIDEAVEFDVDYYYRLQAVGETGQRSQSITMDAPVAARTGPISGFQRRTSNIFLWQRRWLFVITVILCGAVIYWIEHARKGKPLNIRKIAGLEAVDEAVGRATEMGRSCLFVPGIQDMNDIQTIAGITVLARVSRTAAEYDAKVEVPTSRALVMVTARETVQASFLAAGRPDAYNEDLIYYVSDEQFGYVAYLQGMMVRGKPAACFYMGSFFAESLILAETGNSIGAIQVAGTAQPAQLPFFVAACDYTLIGEEFFAASAYLSGSPEELGSLKGADVGKVMVAAFLVIGVVLASLAAITGAEALGDAVNYIKASILT
jgi:hypothetical protein